MEETLILMSDSTTVSGGISQEAREVGISGHEKTDGGDHSWSELHIVTILTRCILGKRNIFTDQISRLDQILPAECSLPPLVFKYICREFGHPLRSVHNKGELGAFHLPYVSFPGSFGMKGDFSIPMG